MAKRKEWGEPILTEFECAAVALRLIGLLTVMPMTGLALMTERIRVPDRTTGEGAWPIHPGERYTDDAGTYLTIGQIVRGLFRSMLGLPGCLAHNSPPPGSLQPMLSSEARRAIAQAKSHELPDPWKYAEHLARACELLPGIFNRALVRKIPLDRELPAAEFEMCLRKDESDLQVRTCGDISLFDFLAAVYDRHTETPCFVYRIRAVDLSVDDPGETLAYDVVIAPRASRSARRPNVR